MLRQRVMTALVALVVLGVVLFVLPPDIGIAVTGLLILAGAWEWSGLLGRDTMAVRIGYVILIGVLAGVFYQFAVSIGPLQFFVACGWWLLAFLWTFFFPTPIPALLRWLAGILILVPLWVVLSSLLKVDATLLLFLLLIVWAADIGAYFAGRKFGRVKLAPAISPGKTWEGVLGGMAVVALVAAAGAYYFDTETVALLPFCFGIAAISVVGDLTVSMFKRTAGVKDSGSLFPGHGGVLDRVDSVSAAAPFYVLGMSWVGLTA